MIVIYTIIILANIAEPIAFSLQVGKAWTQTRIIVYVEKYWKSYYICVKYILQLLRIQLGSWLSAAILRLGIVNFMWIYKVVDLRSLQNYKSTYYFLLGQLLGFTSNAVTKVENGIEWSRALLFGKGLFTNDLKLW